MLSLPRSPRLDGRERAVTTVWRGCGPGSCVIALDAETECRSDSALLRPGRESVAGWRAADTGGVPGTTSRDARPGECLGERFDDAPQATTCPLGRRMSRAATGRGLVTACQVIDQAVAPLEYIFAYRCSCVMALGLHTNGDALQRSVDMIGARWRLDGVRCRGLTHRRTLGGGSPERASPTSGTERQARRA
jgi:hypothetical protein